MSISLTHIGPYNGFPLDILDPGELAQGPGPLRNGQRARALPISALEQACQYLAAGRSLSIPALATPIVFTGGASLKVGRIPFEVYRRHVSIWGFVSTDDPDGTALIGVTLAGPVESQSVIVQGSQSDTIEEAERFFIPSTNDDFITGGSAGSDVPTSDGLTLTLGITGSVSSATLWSLTLVVEPAILIP